MKIAPITKEGQKIGWMLFCPACKCGHAIQTSTERGVYDRDGKMGDTWTLNGSLDKPTIRASLLVKGNRWDPPVHEGNIQEWRRQPWEQHEVSTVCHSFVTDGRIEFLGDCTHDLKGKTVDLEEV